MPKPMQHVNNAKVLITGTRGFLGHKISNHLSLQGYEVISIPSRDRFKEQLKEIAVPDSITHVIHAGFEVDFTPVSKVDSSSLNLENTRILIEFSSKYRIKNFIFLSAAGTLGVSKGPEERRESQLGTSHPDFANYMETRYIREKLACESIFENYPQDLSILYLTTVYGIGMPHETLSTLMKVKDKIMQLVPPGGTSFLALEDLLSFILLIIKKNLSGKYVLSTGNITYMELFQTAIKISANNKKVYFVRIPQIGRLAFRILSWILPQRLISTAVIESSFGYKFYSIEKVRKITNWIPRARLSSILKPLLKG